MAGKPKPWSIFLLMALLLLLGLGGIGGGIVLLSDPTGGAMGLPSTLLAGLFIEDYFWPGIFLIFVMGFAPYLVFYAVWKGLSWGRAAALIQGIVLVGWILFQFILWGSPIFLQIFYLMWGMILILITSLPQTRAYFSTD